MAIDTINPDVKVFYYDNDDAPTIPCVHNTSADMFEDCPLGTWNISVFAKFATKECCRQ